MCGERVCKPLNHSPPQNWGIPNGERGIYVVNSIVWMKCLLGQTYFNFVMDSWIAKCGLWGGRKVVGIRIQTDGNTTAIGINGLAIYVVGKIKLPVNRQFWRIYTMTAFRCSQEIVGARYNSHYI